MCPVICRYNNLSSYIGIFLTLDTSTWGPVTFSGNRSQGGQEAHIDCPSCPPSKQVNFSVTQYPVVITEIDLDNMLSA